MKEFKVSFALADSEFLTAERLVVGAICSTAEVGVDETEDFKVCVTESCLILKNCGFENVEITFSTADGVSAVVSGYGGKVCEGDNEFSLALVSALVSSCEIEKTGEAISKIILKL